MREIKFRGWHTKKKAMFSAEEMASDQLTILPTGQFINVSSTSTRLSEIYPIDKFIPLQYTGLKDKYGKEIYEGDIVTYPYNGHLNLPLKVVWLKGGFYITDETVYERPATWSGATCEVIGNIYENPELLEVKI